MNKALSEVIRFLKVYLVLSLSIHYSGNLLTVFFGHTLPEIPFDNYTFMDYVFELLFDVYWEYFLLVTIFYTVFYYIFIRKYSWLQLIISGALIGIYTSWLIWPFDYFSKIETYLLPPAGNIYFDIPFIIIIIVIIPLIPTWLVKYIKRSAPS